MFFDSIYDDDLMSFAGFRESLISDAVDECRSSYDPAADTASFDRGDLTDYEVDEVLRRLEH